MAQQDSSAVAPNGTKSETTISFASFKPNLFVEPLKTNDAVSFYKNAFAAHEVSRTLNPKRKADQETPLVLSAELQIAASSFVVAEANDSASLVKGGGNGAVFSLETEDIEGAIANAVAAGAVAAGEVVEFEGASGVGRVGKVTDPYGYIWQISTPVKKVAVAEA